MLENLNFDIIKKEMLSLDDNFINRKIKDYELTMEDLRMFGFENNFHKANSVRIVRKICDYSIGTQKVEVFEDMATWEVLRFRYNPGMKVYMPLRSYGVENSNFYRTLGRDSETGGIRIALCPAFRTSANGYVQIITKETELNTPISGDPRDLNIANRMQAALGDKFGNPFFTGEKKTINGRTVNVTNESHHINGNKDDNSFDNLANLPKYVHTVVSFIDGYFNSAERLKSETQTYAYPTISGDLDNIIGSLAKLPVGKERWEGFRREILPELIGDVKDEVEKYSELIKAGKLTANF